MADSGASDDPTAGPSGDGEAGADARREATRRAAEREARERAAALTRAKDRLGAAERDLHVPERQLVELDAEDPCYRARHAAQAR